MTAVPHVPGDDPSRVGAAGGTDGDTGGDAGGPAHAQPDPDPSAERSSERSAEQAARLVLAEPVRQRLAQVASEVLGTMPADEVPASLRAVARFTAAKRGRLGAPALTAALDIDADFRRRVADVVTESAPTLAAAVRDQLPTPASDPVDTAVVAYLTRPDGWEALVAEVGARWESERAERTAAADEIARLRADLADARTQLKAMRSQAAEAARQASADSAEEATRLRNLLRVRTAELRAAEEAVVSARAELDAARAGVAVAGQARDVELAALRARVGELESAVEAARRDVRAERAVDDIRLRLLVDTLTEAAAGIRRELALPAGVTRPADLVAGTSGESSSAATSTVTDPAALDRLLDLPRVHLIVDGYNVTKTGYPELPLADQRKRLAAALAAVHARSGAEITVVFDGGARPPVQAPAPRGVRVLFSAADEIADDLIRRLVAAEPRGRALVVATTDQAVVTDVRRAGAWTVPSAVLLDRLARS